jgi:hypothetical protein
MSKRQPTQKQLEALQKGRETRQANREKIKSMSAEERAAYNQKLREARRNKEVDKLKNPRSQRDKIDVLYRYIVDQKIGPNKDNKSNKE